MMIREELLLTTPPGVAPRTEGGAWGVVMLKATGRSEDSQWFDLMPGFYQPVIRVEWELGTMAVAIPESIAKLLLNKGYARVMTLDEARKYNDDQPDDAEITTPPVNEPEITTAPPVNGEATQAPESVTVADATTPSSPTVSPPPPKGRRRLSDEKDT